MVFNTSCRNNNSVICEVGELEFLDHLSWKIGNVASSSSSGVSKTSTSIGSSIDLVVEFKISTILSIKEMRLFIFLSANSTGNIVPRLSGTVDNHWENIDNIMCQTVSSIENTFIVIFNIKWSSTHLSNTIINSFICIECSFKISIF